MTVIIAVAGNMGCGKTTLARFIADALGWVYIPRKRPGLSYLEDLFNDPQRWSFEAQISFLSSKAIDIQQAVYERLNIVVDRYIYEDVDIFAHYFYKERKLTNRAYQTYLQVARLLLETLPTPHILIYCRVPPEISRQRIASRGYRRFEKFYPPQHIEKLFNLYEQWIEKYSRSPVAIFDAAKYDIRTTEVKESILKDIWTIFQEYNQISSAQLTLFDFSSKRGKSLNILKLLNKNIPIPHPGKKVIDDIKQSIQRFKKGTVRMRPLVYIAAPFTEFSNTKYKNGKIQKRLLDVEEPYGVINPGKYRKNLLAIARSFKKLGIHPILPHKDINKWGHKMLTAEKVAEACRQEIVTSDLFLGIFSRSLGVHFEAGIAAGLYKPMIIVQVEEMGDSFFAQGIGTYPNALALRVKTLEEVPTKMFSPEVLFFLKRHNFLSGELKEE